MEYFFKKKTLKKAFNDKKNIESLMEKIENLSSKLANKMDTNGISVKEIFSYKKAL